MTPTNEILHTTDPDKLVPAILVAGKDADPTPGTIVRGGDSITYTIMVKNNGGEAAKDVYVKDSIPAMSTFASVPEENHGQYHEADNYVSWLIPVIAAGGVAEVSFTVTVDAPTDGSKIVNQAAYGKDWAVDVDGNPAEGDDPDNMTNIVEHPTDNPEPPILDSVKSANPVSGITVYGGQEITYTITVKNNGGGTAENVYVKDVVPAETIFKSVPSGNRGQYHAAGKYVSWLIPSIEAGKEVSVSFTVTVDAPTDGSTIVNQAAYENDWELNQDGTPKEGEEPVTTTNIVEHPTLAPKPNLAAVKSSAPVSGTKVYSGNQIVYTITVTNVSEVDAKDVYVRESHRMVSVIDKTTLVIFIEEKKNLVYNVNACANLTLLRNKKLRSIANGGMTS